MVTARALAPLKILCDQAFPLIARGAVGLFPKGQDVEAELTEAAKYWSTSGLESAQRDQSGQAHRRHPRPSCGVEIPSAANDAEINLEDQRTAKCPTRPTDSQPRSRPVPEAGRAAAEAGRPRVLAIANQKGGVGKTTTAINLGTALAAIGEHVLIVDLDPQGNASTGLGIERKARRTSTYDVLTGAPPMRDGRAADRGAAALHRALDHGSVRPRARDRPASATAPSACAPRSTRTQQAARAAYDFTYVLVDCPPSLNLLTVNAMAAADSILVPLQCEFFALEGLSQLLKTVEQVKTSLNPKLSIHGIVLTMYNSRNNLSNQVVADVRQFMGRKVYDTVIPRNVRISEAPSYGKPVLVYDLKCVGSEAYLRLATEIIQREKELKAG